MLINTLLQETFFQMRLSVIEHGKYCRMSVARSFYEKNLRKRYSYCWLHKTLVSSPYFIFCVTCRHFCKRPIFKVTQFLWGWKFTISITIIKNDPSRADRSLFILAFITITENCQILKVTKAASTSLQCTHKSSIIYIRRFFVSMPYIPTM